MQSSEEQEQIAVIDWCDFRGIPVFHIPNGGKRSKSEAKRFKRAGVRPGIPDLMFPVAKRGYHGMFIEMKYGRNKTTESQEKWLKFLSESGYYTSVCYGFEDAKKAIEWYFDER